MFADLYHRCLTKPWRIVIPLLGSFYFLINTLFAVLYLLQPGAIAEAKPGSFGDAFFFSVQTFSTLGYGKFHPVGVYANCLAAAEAFLGLMGFAMAGALTFAKFSRPTAKVLFSRNAVITQRDGVPTLMFRMANTRASQIVEAHLSVVLARDFKTAEGESARRLLDVKLVRADSPVFAYTWTAFHVIDDSSPLRNDSAETLEKEHAELFLTLTGIEDTFSQTVHTRHHYSCAEILWKRRFVDILSFGPNRVPVVDLKRFHDTLPA